MTSCPICTTETATVHTDEDCVEALIDSGLFHTFPSFNQPPPPADQWTGQERDFAHALALQCIQWKKAEIH